MVSFEKEGTYQAFNANIENARPDSEHSLHAQKVLSQDLPQSPTVVIHPTGDDEQNDSTTQATAAAAAARQSGESDGMSAKGTSAGSSVGTSASSISGTANSDGADGDGDGSASEEPCEPVQTFQYHHSPQYPPRVASAGRSSSQPDLLDAAMNNRLTPNPAQRSTIARPHSTASLQSEFGGSRGRSPAHSRRSPEARPTSYAELLNVPYPQPAPAPMVLDNSGLRNAVGENASLLSTQRTLEMYRANLKKTASVEVQYAFAVFLISTAQEQGIDFDEAKPDKKRAKGSGSDDGGTSSLELLKEARNILQKLASNGYPFAQYYLADGYASGILNKGKEDYGQAFPLFVLAAKHGHAESAYRTALCYEFGAGCRKDPARAVQFLRSAAAKGHPGAMTRLGQACLSGDLGEKRYREGVKWVKLATEAADVMYSTAPYQLGCMYETGYGDDIFQDESYAATLFTQAAELGNAEASFRMGDAYENGKLNCPKDPALSVHFYSGAAERGHAGAMMGLCAWYMVGAPPFLEKDEAEAYAWARKAAELGLVKAQYAIGYFTESGIGCQRDALEANLWYVRAADAGNEHAQRRLAIIRAAASGGTPMEVAPPRTANKIKKAEKAEKGEDGGGQCIVM
jgi:TPR repeat protein